MVSTFPDILVLTKTWLSNDHTEGIPGYFSHHSIQIRMVSGWLSVYIEDRINSRLLTKLSYDDMDMEAYTVEVELTDSKLLILGM